MSANSATTMAPTTMPFTNAPTSAPITASNSYKIMSNGNKMSTTTTPPFTLGYGGSDQSGGFNDPKNIFFSLGPAILFTVSLLILVMNVMYDTNRPIKLSLSNALLFFSTLVPSVIYYNFGIYNNKISDEERKKTFAIYFYSSFGFFGLIALAYWFFSERGTKI